MAKKVDLKAKAKRQKIIAGVGAVLLLAVLAIQVPRTMKMLNAEAPVPPAATATPTSNDPSVLPTPGSVGGSTPSPTPAPGGSGGTLIDSDVAPSPETGQLVSFGRFKSKDPFDQQIDLNAPAAGGGVTQPGEPGSPAKPGGITPGRPSAPGAPAAAAGTALISVNGAEESVAVKADFPKDEPVFTLVSLVKGEAKIAIAGGALASGAPTLTLKKGTPVTLVNTADGIRYELELVAVG